ncbi:Protein of unknown function with PCYCGC motif-containing protein [Evansella caseinilytica]|uniref:Lipoprotein n=1 Tax=Evansella caseinilytica TaxID=1503961 RepID=A0A1H3PNT3_9BACI|nr:PCYCGC motif-containing (lipo)protein [Evansella caseinilytica]SDZ02706.1 Protein of unknown function with PCYCGC motif-containing protein [Evansella caseinilytica]
MYIRTIKGIVLFIVLSIAVAGCNSTTEEDGTIEESNSFPEFVYASSHPGSEAAYQYATDHGEYLDYIPCYCNCYVEPFEHQNVKDCFINNEYSTKEQQVYDPHGSGCGICIETALDVQQMKEEGLPLSEIRDAIDAEYSKYAEPTDTPYPPEGM